MAWSGVLCLRAWKVLVHGIAFDLLEQVWVIRLDVVGVKRIDDFGLLELVWVEDLATKRRREC